MSDLKVLVTGAAGMLGSDLLPILKKGGYNIFPTDITLSEGIDFLDVRNFNQVKEFIEKIKPDIVIHLAAEVDADRCQAEPEHAYLTNTIGTENVALACQRHDIEMVYISSMEVFDGNKPEPYIEFDQPSPINVYGKTKLEGERAVQNLLRKYYIIRTCWLMGGGPKKDKKFVSKVIKMLAGGKKELKIVNDKFGNVTYTVDLSEQLMRLIRTSRYGLYHCANRGYASRYEVAKKIVEVLGRDDISIIPASSADFPSPAPRPRSEACRNYKLELLNIDQMRPWQEALKDYVKRYCNELGIR